MIKLNITTPVHDGKLFVHCIHIWYDRMNYILGMFGLDEYLKGQIQSSLTG